MREWVQESDRLLLPALTASDNFPLQIRRLATQVDRSLQTCLRYAYACRQSVVHTSRAELTAAVSTACFAEELTRGKRTRIRCYETLQVRQIAVQRELASEGSCERIGLLPMQFKA